jgi:hypothetical protein
VVERGPFRFGWSFVPVFSWFGTYTVAGPSATPGVG